MKPILATLAVLTLVTPGAARASDYVVIDRYPSPPCPAVWVEPGYRTVEERVWVPAEYQNIWVELDGRLVPARITLHEGYYAYVERRICITPGHWVYPVYPVDPPIVIYQNPPIPVPAPAQGYRAGFDPTEHGTFSPTYEWPR